MTGPVILSVDTGSDDAIAIMLAVCGGLDVIGCVTSAGSLDLATTSANTLQVLDLLGRPDIPVLAAPSASRDAVPAGLPITARQLPAALHQRTLPMARSDRKVASTDGVDWIVETLRAATEPVTIVSLARASAIAAAFAADPAAVQAVGTLVMMGGGSTGNATPSAEANVWRDAAAARAVLSAPIDKVVLVPLDATHQATVYEADCDRLAAQGPVGIAIATIVRQRIQAYRQLGDIGDQAAAPVHDGLAVALLLDPAVVTTQWLHVDVEVGAGTHYGQTRFIDAGDHRIQVALGADRKRLITLLAAASSSGPWSTPTRSPRDVAQTRRTQQ